MKKIFLSAIISSFFTAAFSQTFMHGVGVSIFVTKIPNTQIGAFGGATYSPRINMMETEALALSIGVPLSIGTSGSYSYNSSYGYTSETSALRFMFNAPLVINLNVGAGSSPENESRFGFFIGGGFAFHYGDFNVIKVDEYGNSFEDNAAFSTSGVAANAGIRIAVGSHQKNIETRLSYMKGMNKERPSIFGMAALFNF